jgi:glycolate oxidase iron-sulfur subunit
MQTRIQGETPAAFLDEEQALACVHCGLCLASCPTYLETGNENDSPRGRIYLMRMLQQERLSLHTTVTPVEHIDRCLGCRACETACPSGVAYGALLEHTRDHIERNLRRPFLQRILRNWLIEGVFPYPSRFRMAVMPAIWLKKMGVEHLLPGFLRESLSLIPDRIQAHPLPGSLTQRERPSKGRVGLLTGCVMPVLFNGTHHATIRLVERLGFDLVIPGEQVCCGALFAHSGKLDMAKRMARQNIEAFAAADCDVILVNAAGCGAMLKEYQSLFSGDTKQEESARLLSANVRDFSEWIHELAFEYLGELLKKRQGIPGEAPDSNPFHLLNVPTTFHDACHLAHAQGITREPRELVQAVAGDLYAELPEADICCGSAGSYNLTEPQMAKRLQARKIQHIERTNARIVVTTNPGCILQMEAGLRKRGLDQVKVMHLADYLLQAIEELEGVKT